MTEDTKKRPKTGGRAPARATTFHNVSIRLTPEEHRLFRMASGHAGLPGGQMVANWSRRYLARVGVKVGGPSDVKDAEHPTNEQEDHR